jgi:hypothetical protein
MSATDVIGNPSSFLTNLLNVPATSIPKGAHWAVFFHNLQNSILPGIELAYRGEPNSWKTVEAARKVLSTKLQTSKGGCLFCDAIDLPGDGMVVTNEGIKTNGYIRSPVGGGRNDFQSMRMTFLDTNISFVDSFLRGWSLATASFGLVARNPSDPKNYRTNMTCYKFTATPAGPTVIQTFHFIGLCCISVSQEEFNYLSPSGPVKREAQFIYNSYYVDTESNNDLTNRTDIIKSTQTGATVVAAEMLNRIKS